MGPMMTADAIYGPLGVAAPSGVPVTGPAAQAAPAAAAPAATAKPGPDDAASRRRALALLVGMAGAAVLLTQVTVRGELEVGG